MRLRQIALVARELDRVVEQLCGVLGVTVSFHDPGVAVFGLCNAVMPLGDTFLEVVSPAQPGTTAERFLDRRGGDGGYMVILQSDNLDADRVRLAKLGVRIVWQMDLPDIRGTHLHPRDLGGAILSLDAAVPATSWRWAGPGWEEAVHTDIVNAITAVEIQATDPAVVAQRWADVLACPLSRAASTEWQITLDRSSIRFVEATDGRGDGVGGFDVHVVDRERLFRNAARHGVSCSGRELTIAGTRINLK